MNTIARRVPIRLTPFSIFGLLLAVVGCGTIAVDISTEIVSQQEIKQNIEYVISGPIAALFIEDGEIELGEGVSVADLDAIESAGWDFEMDVITVEDKDALRMRINQTFTGVDAAEQFRLASEALSEEDTSTSLVPVLEITETEDDVVYDLRMTVSTVEQDGAPIDGAAVPTVEPLIIDGTPFPAFPDFSDGLGDFTDALTDSFDDFISVKWTVEMPGHVSESNATSEDDNRLTWDLTLADVSDGGKELFARSEVSKSSGGSCNL